MSSFDLAQALIDKIKRVKIMKPKKQTATVELSVGEWNYLLYLLEKHTEK